MAMFCLVEHETVLSFRLLLRNFPRAFHFFSLFSSMSIRISFFVSCSSHTLRLPPPPSTSPPTCLPCCSCCCHSKNNFSYKTDTFPPTSFGLFLWLNQIPRILYSLSLVEESRSISFFLQLYTRLPSWLPVHLFQLNTFRFLSSVFFSSILVFLSNPPPPIFFLGSYLLYI